MLKELLKNVVNKVFKIHFSIHDLKRDIQARLGKSNLGGENYGGETFLSEEVSINILQETRMAFRRCSVVRELTFKSTSGFHF